MFEEYYAPLPDRDAYLERIGLKGETLPPTAETLHRLISAHLATVPFENLDVYEKGLCPDLRVQGLFDKLVTYRRGGSCFLWEQWMKVVTSRRTGGNWLRCLAIRGSPKCW